MSTPEGQLYCFYVKRWYLFLSNKNICYIVTVSLFLYMYFLIEFLLQEAVPFAVIGANTVIEVKGKKVRGRMYPWGVVEVENPDHCDFIKLRTMLM